MASENMPHQSRDDSSNETPRVESENQWQFANASSTSAMAEDPTQLLASDNTGSAEPQKEPIQQTVGQQSTEPDGYIPLTLDVCQIAVLFVNQADTK